MPLNELQKRMLIGIVILLCLFAGSIILSTVQEKRIAARRKEAMEQPPSGQTTKVIAIPKYKKARIFYSPRWAE